MNTFTNMLKDYQVGTWCKRAAWVLLVVGIIEVALTIYNDARQFGLTGQPFSWQVLLEILQFGLGFVTSVIFYFFILYAAGALVNHVIGTQAMDDEVGKDQDIAL